MRKYLEIARVYFKTQLVWRADIIFNMIFTVSRIVFAYLLWKTIFNGREMVAELTFNAMLSYYIVNSFLTQLEMSSGISGEICSRIRSGTFTKYLVIPVNVEGYFAAMEAGVVTFYLLFDLAAAVVWIFVFGIEFTFVGEPLVILCALLMSFLGMLFMVQLNFYIGILTLKYEEITVFLRVKNNLLTLVTGSIIPLVLLPEVIVSGMRLLPFYYITYLPSMLLIGKSREEILTGLCVIAAWCVVMQLIIRFTWNKYVGKYDGVGI